MDDVSDLSRCTVVARLFYLLCMYIFFCSFDPIWVDMKEIEIKEDTLLIKHFGLNNCDDDSICLAMQTTFPFRMF